MLYEKVDPKLWLPQQLKQIEEKVQKTDISKIKHKTLGEYKK